ncbi:MAG TPA: alpha/beta hydrolase [Longimicrobiaceae bacterium]|jgi:pimeloyl-ACP methyl ester carboxylesterase
MSRTRAFDPMSAASRADGASPSTAAGPVQRATVVSSYRIHSLEAGAEGEALVLLHGLSGSGRWWARNIAGLAHAHRVLIPDLVGYGRTPLVGRVPRMDEMADLLAAWLDALAIDEVDIAGHSMGGQVAIHFAARHPDRLRRLVLVDAAGIPRPTTPRNVARFAMEIAPLWRWGDPRFLPVIVGDAWNAGPLTLMRSIGHILRDDVRPLLSGIRAPTLVVWGERDNWVPFEHALVFRRSIPGSSLAVIRGTAHMPMVDRPDAFNRLVLRFLDGERVGS